MACGLLLALVAAPAAQAAPQPGINTHLMWSEVDDADLDRQLDWAQEAGAALLRVDVGWSSLQERGPDQYSDWYVEKLDKTVAAAEERGIKLLMTLTWTPCWASSAPATIKANCSGSWWSRGVQYYGPTNPADYGRAMGWLAGRYKGRAAAYEVWNEPNSNTYFKASDKPAEYAALVKAAYPAAKAADAATPVLAGALESSDADFAEELFKHGIAGNFDGFSFHPYPGEYSPLDELMPQHAPYSFAAGVPLMRRTLLAHGADVPLWLTEIGWSTNTVRGKEPWRNGVSEAKQAEYLTLAYRKAAEWDYVRAMIWFNMRDTSDDPTDTWGNAGLRRGDGSARPAYEAFKGVTGGALKPLPRTVPVLPGPKSRKKSRLRVRFVRRGGKTVAKGRAPRGSKLRFAVRRKRSKRGRIARSSVAYSDARGNFDKALNLYRGEWTVTVSVVGTGLRTSRSLRAGS
jgi:hypothetical protein